MAKKTAQVRLSNAEADEIFQSVFACKPAIPEADLQEVADLVGNQERVIRAWRLAAFLGTKGGDFFKNMTADEAATLAEAVEPLNQFSELMNSMSEVSKTVVARLSVACIFHGVDPVGGNHLATA